MNDGVDLEAGIAHADEEPKGNSLEFRGRNDLFEGREEIESLPLFLLGQSPLPAGQPRLRIIFPTNRHSLVALVV